jgi:hypothetical protein
LPGNRGIGLLHSDDDAFIGILVRFTPLGGDALIIGDALNRGQLVIFRTGLNSFTGKAILRFWCTMLE